MLAAPDDEALVDESTTRGDRVAARLDLERALAQLTPRERSLLWCAYVDGQSHEEEQDSPQPGFIDRQRGGADKRDQTDNRDTADRINPN